MMERSADQTARRRRVPKGSLARAGVAALAALAVATLLACDGAGILSGSEGQRDTDGQPPADAKFERGEDWRHLHQVLAYLEEYPPEGPVVYLLGGSAARESTVSDRSWRREVDRAGGPRVEVFNLAASNQSFDHSITIVERLPDAPSLVIIGVNVGRYTNGEPDTPGSAELPLKGYEPQKGDPVIEPYTQHRFKVDRIDSEAKKRGLLDTWELKNHPVFSERFDYNAGRLEALVQACLDRGFRPVILNMPLNLEIIGDRMDEPRARYERHSRAVAARYDIPFVDWVPRIDLVNEDFMDNWHLVEPGRVKWQTKLSALTVTLLRRYGLAEDAAEGVGAEAPDAPTPDDDSGTQ